MGDIICCGYAIVGKQYYVYEQYTVDDNKIFYIGIEKDPNFEYTTRQDIRVVMLENYKGIAMRKLYSGLSAYQARVAQMCLMRKEAEEGGYLLNFEFESILRELKCTNEKVIHSESYVAKDRFIRVFFPEIYNEVQKFDLVDYKSLSCITFYSNQNLELSKWLMDSNCKINKTVSTGTCSIIVDKRISYYDYSKYKNQGKKVLAIEDVLKFIADNPPFVATPTKAGIKRTITKPKYDKGIRDKIRDFFCRYEKELMEYYDRMVSNRLPLKEWEKPFKADSLKSCRVELELEGELSLLIKYKIIAIRDSNKNSIDTFIRSYKKVGLFREIASVLKDKEGYGADYLLYKTLSDEDND